MDLLRRLVGSGDAADRVAITRFSIRQSPDSRIGATVWSVFHAHERSEALVSGYDLIRDRRENRIVRTLLVGAGNARWEVLYRFRKRAALARLACDVVGFGRDFLKKKTRRHQTIAQSL